MLYGVGQLGAKAKSGVSAVVADPVQGPDANNYAFDLSKAVSLNDYNASYAVNAFSVQFNDTGSELFYNSIAGQLKKVSLSTNYDITTTNGSIESANFSFSAAGMKITNSGAKLYTVNYGDDLVHEYTMSTPYDISTLSHVQSFNVNTSTSGACSLPMSVEFKPDGTKMFVWDWFDDAWYEFALSTAYDVSTASFTDSFDVGADVTNNGACFSFDGTRMYYMKFGHFYQRTMTTPFDISSAGSETNTLSLRSSNQPKFNPANSGGLWASADGMSFYYATGQGIYQAKTDTQYELVDSRFDQTRIYKDFTHGSYKTVFFKDDGTKMYFIHGNADTVQEYDLSRAWDMMSAIDDTPVGFSVASQDTTPIGITFKTDGTEMYVAGDANNSIFQYTLSTAWLVTSASYTRAFDVSAKEVNPQAVTFKPDGSKMYVGGYTSDSIHEYNLSTPWDISTASFNQSSVNISNVYAIVFNSNGTKLYTTTSNSIKEFTLSSAYDISGLTLNHTNDVSSDVSTPINAYGIYYKPDGSRIFVAGLNYGIYELATDDKKMVETVYSPSINIIRASASGVGEAGSADYNGKYDVLDVGFVPDASPSDFSGRLYIGIHIQAYGSGTYFYNDLCIGAIQILDSSEARVHSWQGTTDFQTWKTTLGSTFGTINSQPYEDVIQETFVSLSASSTTADAWNINTATGSTYTGANNGISNIYNSSNSGVLPIRGLGAVSQSANEPFLYAESSSPVTNGDFIWLQGPSVTLSNGGLHHARIAYNLTSKPPNSGTQGKGAKAHNTFQMFWAGV